MDCVDMSWFSGEVVPAMTRQTRSLCAVARVSTVARRIGPRRIFRRGPPQDAAGVKSLVMVTPERRNASDFVGRRGHHTTLPPLHRLGRRSAVDRKVTVEPKRNPRGRKVEPFGHSGSCTARAEDSGSETIPTDR